MGTPRRTDGRAAGLLWAFAAALTAWGALALAGVQLPGASLLAARATLPGTTAAEWSQAPDDTPTTRGADDVAMATDVLTRPDRGTAGVTVRWAGPRVTYRLHLDTYPAAYRQLVRDVMAYAARHTGLEVVETDGPAQIEVWPRAGNGAHVEATIDASNHLVAVRFELGCCRSRAAWEDGLQAFGPLGDHADSRSVFTNDQSALRPGSFDAWVLGTLYRLPAGSTPDQVRAALGG